MTDHRVFYNEHARHASTFQAITPDYYHKFNVKRGLRNDDGTGVLVGLTEIGDVHGYIMDEQERTPVEGRLRYRGIDVYDIVSGFQKEKRMGFEETAYLLLFGCLPTQEKLVEFNQILSEARALPGKCIKNFTHDQPSPDIMNSLARTVLSLYSYDSQPEDYSTPNLLRQSIELIARFPSLVAYSYQARKRYFEKTNLHFHAPDQTLSTGENFLRMIRDSGEFDPLEAEIIDLSLVLHAEHGGGNNSSFVVRVVSSAFTDTYSAIAAAIGSLKGARHGGANNRVMAMMADLQAHVPDWENENAVRAYLAKLIRKEAFDKTGLVYGMGHAIYTISDPRAVLIQKKAEELARAKGDSYVREYELYRTVQNLSPLLFKELKNSTKVIAPNVDFYSGFVYKMLDIPPELYTPIFAVSRIAGWCAHRIEELSGDSRIIRPAYKNVLGKKDYTALSQR